jgi:hypothetical protein
MRQAVDVKLEFSSRPDGIIDAFLAPGHEMFNRALADAVSSRAPSGASRPGLSTYWIDQVEERVRQAAIDGETEPFATGNVTILRLDGPNVVAAFDFDPDGDDTDAVPVVDFLALLSQWRQRVVAAGGVSGTEAQLVDGPEPIPMGPVDG